MEDSKSNPTPRSFDIPSERKGSIKNNESEIFLLKGKTNKIISEIEQSKEFLFAPGFVTMFAGTTEPDSWLFCNGSAVDRQEYADLFAAIGTSYGSGNGTTTFNVPDLQQRFPLGSGSPSGVGSTGGSNTHAHTVTAAETSTAHAHTFSDNASTSTTGSHSHSVSVDDGGSGSTSNNGFHSHGSTMNNAGAGNTGSPSSTNATKSTGAFNVSTTFHTHSIPNHAHTMNNPGDGLHGHSVFNHSHGASSGSNGGHSHSVSVSGNTNSPAASHTHDISSQNESNVPPYLTINYIIKT